VSFGRRLTAFFFATSRVHSQEVQFPVSVSRSAGDPVRQQTPYRCQSRNHGLCASISSCRRFAAARSLALSGLISSASNISSSCSMSSIVRSMSMPSQYPTWAWQSSTGAPPACSCAPTPLYRIRLLDKGFARDSSLFNNILPALECGFLCR
jgi:hypothetical protein